MMSEATVATLDRVSRDEQQLRVDVAAAFRLLHRHGMSDLVAGNISARLPGADWFFTHPHGHFFEEMKASDLIKVDMNCQPMGGPDDRVHYSAVRQGAFGFKSETRRQRRTACSRYVGDGRLRVATRPLAHQ